MLHWLCKNLLHICVIEHLMIKHVGQIFDFVNNHVMKNFRINESLVLVIWNPSKNCCFKWMNCGSVVGFYRRFFDEKLEYVYLNWLFWFFENQLPWERSRFGAIFHTCPTLDKNIKPGVCKHLCTDMWFFFYSLGVGYLTVFRVFCSLGKGTTFPTRLYLSIQRKINMWGLDWVPISHHMHYCMSKY